MQACWKPGAKAGNSGGVEVGARVARLLGIGGVLTSAAWLSPVRLGVVVGHSMQPTLCPGQFFVHVRETPSGGALRRGDVVVLRLGGETCVKRIFALGGDRFWSFRPKRSDERSFLGGGADIRQWKRRFPFLIYRRVQVPPGTVYVLGDHPTSVDSRRYGPVPVSRIEGRVVFPAASDVRPELTPRVWTGLPPLPNRPSRS